MDPGWEKLVRQWGLERNQTNKTLGGKREKRFETSLKPGSNFKYLKRRKKRPVVFRREGSLKEICEPPTGITKL